MLRKTDWSICCRGPFVARALSGRGGSECQDLQQHVSRGPNIDPQILQARL